MVCIPIYIYSDSDYRVACYLKYYNSTIIASIARRIHATSRAAPPSLSGVSSKKLEFVYLFIYHIFIYLYIYIYIYVDVPSDDVVSSNASSRGIYRGISDLLGILVSAGLTRIFGVYIYICIYIYIVYCIYIRATRGGSR